MVRWEPDARGRLEQAAFSLFAERGFENTTVAEIAERAGLTERTFFRHYADKREVLFSGSAAFVEVVTDAVASAASSLAPIDAVAAGFEAVGAFLLEVEAARERQRVIAANPDLQERELSKMASLSTAIADALRGRGLDEAAAALTAQIGIAIFRVAFERWLDESNDRDYPTVVRRAFDEGKAVAATA
jgi:AcrR family transcriptional regulator